MKKNRGFQGPPQWQAPSVLDQRLQQAIALHQRGMLSDAKRIYEEILASRPKHFDALHLLGVIACQTRDLNRGEELIGRAIKLEPGNALAHLNRGNALKDLKRFDEAVACFNKAIALKPDLVEAYSNRGNVLYYLKRFDEAVASYDKTIALRPGHAEAYSNRGNALFYLKRFDEALASCDKALALKPDYAEACNNRGNALCSLKRLDEALASYNKAVALKPDFAEAYNNQGDALYQLKRPEDALASCDKAIALKRDYAEAYYNRANALKDLMRLEDALASYDKAFSLDPDLVGAEGERLYMKKRLCDWTNINSESANLVSSIRNKKANSAPLIFVGVKSSPDDQLRCARSWVAETCPPSGKAIWRGEQYRHDRIRIAYVSEDFREHPVSLLIAEMLELHDKSRFDVSAVSLGYDDNSRMYRRLKAAFGQFIDARTSSDEQIANLVRSSEVDILVDLMGFTGDARPGIFAQRPAPVQVNYLGYPGTMGADYIDYILADRFVVPQEMRGYYSEKVVHLPNSFMANDSTRQKSSRVPRRSECNLPETGFVFCAFNSVHKITPDIFDIWMRLLRQVDDSVVWLSGTNETAIRNLRREAESRGIDPRRLVFAQRLALNEDHLARHELADLFLDTLPYNAHASASDALWAGLPVLTCAGETFAGRVAASLLNAIELPELIAATPEAYERMAIDLATHPDKLTAIKHKLKDNRLTTPLFDTKVFTKHIEAAYTAMHHRHQAGLAPDHIVVPN